MAILELLAGTAGTGVVASGQLLLHNRGAGLLGTGVLSCGTCLVGVGHLLLVQVLLALGVLVALGALFGGSLLYLLHFWDGTTHQDRHDAVVHVVDHGIPHLGTLQFEDEQRVFLFVAGVLH